MKSLMFAAIVAVGLMVGGAASTAEAGGPHRGHGHHGHHGHYYGGHGHGYHHSYHRGYYHSPNRYRSYNYYRPNYYRGYRGNGIYYGSPGFSFGIRF